jgi:MFS transporter, MHS family, proline/betaine transporter
MAVSTSITHGPADEATIRRAIVACGIGQVFEIYDFVIYGLMAGALSRAFFPSEDPIAGLLSTFATFAVGFVMRPIGAVVIGTYGDRHGRRAALVVTIGLMAAATGLIGLIPSYATLGVAAPVILVLCRMAQGFSTGGEWGGAAAFLVEYAPPARRGAISSYQQAATAIGLLAATLVSFMLSSLMDTATFTAWGWRVPFLIGFVLGPIGYYLRTKVEETPAFEATVALVHFQTEGAMAPTPSCYAVTGWRRTESGRPATNIRFSTATAMAASVCWAAKPRARGRGPISVL